MKHLTALAMLCATPVALAATPQDFAMSLPIETNGEGAAWQIELSTEVYTWSQDPALRDLMVFNAEGHAVPVASWHGAAPKQVREQRADVPLLALPVDKETPAGNDLRLLVERDASGRLQRIDASDTSGAADVTPSRDALIDLSAFAHGIDALELRWSAPTTGVIARYSIDASDDLQRWRSLRNDAAIVLLEQDGARVERREISLPGARGRYLRLHRLDAGPLLEGLSAQARRTEYEAGASTPLNWQTATLESDPASAGTRFAVHLPAALPVEALRIDLGSDNALAQITLSSPSASTGKAQTAWSEYARFVAFRLRQGEALIDSGEIVLPHKIRQQDFRLESRTPLAHAPTLSFGYRPERIVFLAEGAGPYQLVVGSLRERRVDAPLEAAMASLRGQFGEHWQPPIAQLGAAHESGGAQALTTAPIPPDWRRWLLSGVLVAGAGVVATIALSLLRGKR